jgi:hypothetical protein
MSTAAAAAVSGTSQRKAGFHHGATAWAGASVVVLAIAASSA